MMTCENKKKKNYMTRIALSMVVVLIVAAYSAYTIRQDASIEAPTGFALSKSTEVIKREYFDIAVTRLPLKAQTYDPENIDGNYTLGANGDQDRLDFGILPTSSPARKQIDLSNDRNEDIKVRIEAFGNISEYVEPDDDEFVLAPGEKKAVIIEFTGAPEVSELSGELDISVIVPKSGYEKMIIVA